MLKRYTLGPSITESAFGGAALLRISEDARKSIVFFGIEEPGKVVNGVQQPNAIKYRGTGGCVAHVIDGHIFGYIVTARHVAKQLDHEFFIRVNLVGGGSFPIPVIKMDWSFHPDPSVDIAAAYFPFDPKKFDISYMPSSIVLVRDQPARVRPGDLVNLVGLFHLHTGAKKNIPIVHTGHIAALPDPEEKITLIDRITKKPMDVEDYLIEAQTLEGSSGSLVFVQEPVGVVLPDITTRDKFPAKAYGDVSILGVYSGSWDGVAESILSGDRVLPDGTRVPVGMGLVVPGERILELLMDHPKLKKERAAMIASLKSANAASTDFLGSVPPANDGNPKHREDFTRLLDAAAQKQKPAE